MASTFSLLKKATALATLSLQGDGDRSGNSNENTRYDALVKASGVLDLILELPCFEAELGKYSSSLELCGSILARSIRRKRQTLTAESPRRPRSPDGSSATPSSCGGTAAGCALAGVTPVGPPTPGISTPPMAWVPENALAFDSIVGNSAAKRALFEHVVLPLKLSDEARSAIFVGIRSSGSNVLLHGPPGTGKTTIAQATSQEAGAAFFSVTPSSILSKYQGESERVLHQLFDDAKKTKPSIIFLDELDALAPSRDGQDDVQTRRLLAEILLQTSQLRPKDQVVIIAATNRVDDVDVAMLRRFHSRVFVGPPSHKERVDMINNFMKGIDVNLDDKQLSILADRTRGWSGSDIKSFCREACMGPLRFLYEQEDDLEEALLQRTREQIDLLRPVQMSDFATAYETLMGSSAVALTSDPDELTRGLVGDELFGEFDGQMRECKEQSVRPAKREPQEVVD
ncbi:unnamed protein product [Scytosiphon promiscuus]